VAAALVGTTLLSAGCGSDDSATSSSAPLEITPSPDADQPVIFVVTGTAPVDLTYRLYPEDKSASAPVQCQGVVNAAALPWFVECDAKEIWNGVAEGKLIAQARGTHTEFECSIRLGDTIVSTQKAAGKWAIAACTVDEIYWPWR